VLVLQSCDYLPRESFNSVQEPGHRLFAQDHMLGYGRIVVVLIPPLCQARFLGLDRLYLTFEPFNVSYTSMLFR